MAKFKQHSRAGLTIGGGSALVRNLLHQMNRMATDQEMKFNWKESLTFTVLGGLIGVAGGVLPDVIEPATSSYHRKAFHSWAALFVLGGGIHQVNQGNLPEYAKSILTAGGLGYISHLVLDSETPNSLPII